jgi:protein-S-isoprenylcysteine O-methyltransferase Ste14
MNDYGLWLLVAVNSAVFIIFAASFFHPRSRRDWKAMGGFSAFIVALMVEMYGFPLTIYLLSGWAGSRFESLTLTHDGGHLWSELIGWKGDPHFSPFHLASYVFIALGFWAIAAAWPVLLRAAKEGTLATTGPYARVRHPQYVGFLAIMVGFLLQWPTIPTIVMFPVLVYIYWRLSIQEEASVAAAFPAAWAAYARQTPRFVPRRRHDEPPASRGGRRRLPPAETRPRTTLSTSGSRSSRGSEGAAENATGGTRLLP